MAQSSMPPPPSGGGGSGKWLVILVLLITAGVGVFLAMPKSEPPPPPAKVEPPKAERQTALADDTLEIPEPEKDAGVAKPEETKKPTRTVVSDSWSCQGDIPQADIKRVMADSQIQIRSCYERRLRNNNMLQGNVSLQVKVAAGGKVAGTRVRGTLQDKEVYDCIQGVAKNWQFPTPSGGACAVIEAPYNFKPKN